MANDSGRTLQNGIFSETIDPRKRFPPRSMKLTEGSEPKAQSRCWHCGRIFETTDGYVGPGGYFYCEACVWELAENGEFYCG